MKGRESFCGLKAGHIEESTPYVCGWEATSSEARNDAEVVRATFESSPKIGVGRCRSGNDRARGENKLVADDIGADETEAGGKEGKPAYPRQTC